MSWEVLEILKAGASVQGLTASGAATVESVQWIGQRAVKVVLCDGAGRQMRLRPMNSVGRAEPVAVAKRGLPGVVAMAVEEFEWLKGLSAASRLIPSRDSLCAGLSTRSDRRYC